MGKAAKFKKLRKLASQLPAININKEGQVEIKSGAICVAEGILKDLAGNDIDPNLYYKFPAPKSVPLNHNKKMKEAYKKYGMKGVETYGHSVINYVNSKTAAATEPA